MTNCSQKPVKEIELEKQVAENLKHLIIPDDVADKIAEELKSSLKMKRDIEDTARDRLSSEKCKLEEKLNLLYEDRLNSVITLDFYNHKSVESETQTKDIESKLSLYLPYRIFTNPLFYFRFFLRF